MDTRATAYVKGPELAPTFKWRQPLYLQKNNGKKSAKWETDDSCKTLPLVNKQYKPHFRCVYQPPFFCVHGLFSYDFSGYVFKQNMHMKVIAYDLNLMASRKLPH